MDEPTFALGVNRLTLAMQIIQAVLFEPVGCLAEFPAREFDEIAARLFGEAQVNQSGSEAYWQLLDLLDDQSGDISPSSKRAAEELEIQAINEVELYEDVMPALSELRNMAIQLVIASSLSGVAIRRFLERFAVREFLSAVWDRDSAGGVKIRPLARAIETASLKPQHVITLVDTQESLHVAEELGTNSVLMINDYEQGRRLALHAPTGGVVSLRELPDAIRLVAENAKWPRP